MKNIALTFLSSFIICSTTCFAQSTSWQLWASGLPTGVYPRMAIAPNHDIFYTLLGTGINLGYIHKANTLDTLPNFIALPQIPLPTTLQNNIVALGYNINSEPLAGIYRTNMSEPWLFCYNSNKQHWDTAQADAIPTLGGQCIATSKNGVIYVGTRWAYIYKSTDNGKTFKAIDESKSIAKNYPCYYPSFLNGSTNNGSIFTISIDQNNRVYAGTETAGLIFSDDEGITWQPADLFACQTDSNQYDTLSAMGPLAKSGNVAGIGFTKENNVVWSGSDMWFYGWKNKLGFANMKDSSVNEAKGLPDYLVQTGQQVSKIVTTTNGTIFLHSGSSNGAKQIGIYKSTDGINWELFNTGITGLNDGQSQGSLAVDGNKVFMATHDGKVWMYDATIPTNSITNNNVQKIKIYPNPVKNSFSLNFTNQFAICKIINPQGKIIFQKQISSNINSISVEDLLPGIYTIIITENEIITQYGKIVKQ